MRPATPPSFCRQHWRIDRLWNGDAAQPNEVVALDFARHGENLAMRLDAPFHGDPPPMGEPGPRDRLWDHEVVELFLLAEPDHYLEIELGPHGHHWVLQLAGRRRVHRDGLPIAYHAEINGQRWHGHAELPWAYIPAGACRGNAYAIHGEGSQRRYLAYYPVPGSAPDFHRLEHFGPVGPEEAPR
jgi:hypothetical protein